MRELAVAIHELCAHQYIDVVVLTRHLSMLRVCSDVASEYGAHGGSEVCTGKASLAFKKKFIIIIIYKLFFLPVLSTALQDK